MRKTIHLLIVVFFMQIFITSCTLEKRLYRPGYNVMWEKSENNKEKVNLATDAYTVENNNISLCSEKTKDDESDESLTASTDNSSSLYFLNKVPKKITNTSKHNQYISGFNNGLLNIIDTCDIIVLKNGTEIPAKEIELGAAEITYKRCDDINGPILVLKTQDVSMIKYSYGAIDVLSSGNDYSNIIIEDGNKSVKNEKQLLGSAVGSFILSLAGLIIFGIPLGITAAIFGIISVSKINKNPGKYVGLGFAVLGIIIGFVDIVGVMILLSML